jgi:hypothetical protein
MKVYEIVTDWLICSPLFEMAYKRKFATDKIRELAPNIAEHLVKVLAFNDEAKNHWITEINTWVRKINNITLKPKGNKLPADTYYELLWDEPLNNGVPFITHMIESMVRHEYENVSRSNLSDQQIHDECERILGDLSYDLASNCGYIDIRKYIK